MLASGLMPDGLTREEIARIALLAQLELTEEEAALFTTQLSQILDYARQVQAVDTSSVPPTSHVLAGAPVDRADTPRPGLDPATALDAAPDPAPEQGLFRVPRVIG
jgi:aspartyl-tRNA(Asn)/glutamyl-tRNA(Gln) amidotransferase subunit C